VTKAIALEDPQQIHLMGYPLRWPNINICGWAGMIRIRVEG
jgi:hypothetical protein